MKTDRYRRIRANFWNDQKIRALSHRARFIYIYIRTHPLLTPLGWMRLSPPGLAADIGIPGRAFARAFQELTDAGLIVAAINAPLIWAPDFLADECPASPNAVKALAAGFEALPECPEARRILNDSALILNSLSPEYAGIFARKCASLGAPLDEEAVSRLREAGAFNFSEDAGDGEEEGKAAGEGKLAAKSFASPQGAAPAKTSSREQRPKTGTAPEDMAAADDGGNLPSIPMPASQEGLRAARPEQAESPAAGADASPCARGEASPAGSPSGNPCASPSARAAGSPATVIKQGSEIREIKKSVPGGALTPPDRLSFVMSQPVPEGFFIGLPCILSGKSRSGADSFMRFVAISEVEAWQANYQGIDVRQELRRMQSWLCANWSKRKTASGIDSAIVNWLNRAQDRASPMARQSAYSRKIEGRARMFANQALADYQELREKACADKAGIGGEE